MFVQLPPYRQAPCPCHYHSNHMLYQTFRYSPPFPPYAISLENQRSHHPVAATGTEFRKQPGPRIDKRERHWEPKRRALNNVCNLSNKRRRGIANTIDGSRSRVQTRDMNQGPLDQNLLLENKDILSHIVSFLDIKSLLKFSMTSKDCLEAIRPDHVVQAALYQGGHAKTNMERIVQIYQQEGQHLFAPSIRRMLRLCNGRMCEKKHCKNRVHLVSKNWGVFLCSGCLETGGFIVNLKRFDELYPFVSHCFSIPDGCHAIRLWAKPFLDSEGEWCGPRFTLEQCQMSRSTSGSDESSSHQKQHELDAARRKAYLPLIESVFQKHTELAKERLRADRLRRYKASVAAQAKKRRRIVWGLREIERGLGSEVDRGILAHEWIPGGNGKQRIQFLDPTVHCVLSRFIAVPSRLTKTRLQSLATQLRQTVTEEARNIHES